MYSVSLSCRRVHTLIYTRTYIYILPTHKCACVYSPSSQCRHSVYYMLLQAPRAVAMMAVSPGETHCEDATVLYYYIPEGVQKANKGDAENEFHLWKLSLYVIYCPACVRPRVYCIRDTIMPMTVHVPTYVYGT